MKIMFSSKRHYYLARVSIFLIVAALIAGMVGCGGTPSSVEIQDWYDLDAIRDNLAGNHILMNDLDSTTAGYTGLASPTANGGKGWQPIGTEDSPFTGTFDGQGHEIRDLFINRPDESVVGLFSAVDTLGCIKNLGVVNVDVTGGGHVGGSHVGGLVGRNDGTVSNSYSTGNVIGGCEIGGLVGENRYGTVSNSYSSCNVIGNGDVGGLVGMNSGAVSNSYATGNVTGNRGVGGLVGQNHDGTVSNSYSTGNVIATDDVGGLVGENEGDSTVSNSYSTGNVTGNNRVGGLVGVNNEGTVSNSYSTGNVTGDYGVGGLVGEHQDPGPESEVRDSFWDTETSGQATSEGGTGKTTAEMQDIDTFSDAAWDIVTVANPGTRNPSYIWNIVDDETYPYLSWEP